MASYPAGKQVKVHHAPNDPADAVLHVGLEGLDLFMMMFMLPFNIFMLMLWFATWIIVYGQRLQPKAGGARIINEGQYLRVRLSPLRPVYTAAVVAGGLSLALVFIVAIGFGFSPPISVMIGAWGLILSGGGFAYLYVHHQWARGDSDLLIDEFQQSITLPREYGRNDDVVVPAKKIVAIEVEEVRERDSDGDTHHYIPTIIFTDDSGSQRREKLTKWKDETSAEALAEWLRQRLQVQSSREASGRRSSDVDGEPRS